MNELDKQLTQVTNAMKNSNKSRMFERYQAIKLYLEGYTAAKISSIIGRCQKQFIIT